MFKISPVYNHSHKKQMVWKHGPNWPFYAFILRTKLYWNLFFFIGHQNVNKPKSRAARTSYGLIFLPFYKIIGSFFPFLCQDANKTRSNCDIIGSSFSKKHKITLYKTQMENQTTQIINFSLFLLGVTYQYKTLGKEIQIL